MTSSIAAINVAKGKLGLDEDTYRAKLTNITGKSSLRAMSEAERQKVLTVFRNEGFKPSLASRRADGNKQLTGRFAKKLQALWIAGWNLGVVHDRKDAALLAFVHRQTGLDHVRFLHHPDDARAAIEAMKAWLGREGWVDWSNHGQPAYHRTDGYRIARAQWKKLGGASDGFRSAVCEILGRPEPEPTISDQQWIKVMNELGRRVRARKTGAK